MTMQRTVLLTVACFSITVCAVQTLGRARRSNRTPVHPSVPGRRNLNLQGLTGEQKARAIKEWRNEPFKQKERAAEERGRLRRAETWKRALRIDEQQWKMIKPILDRRLALSKATDSGARGWALNRAEQRFVWRRHSERTDLTRATTLNVLIERNKIADELVGLLEDENSKDEDIRKKIDALQQVREKARKELAEVKKELAASPMTARQEAIFLVTGCIE